MSKSEGFTFNISTMEEAVFPRQAGLKLAQGQR